MKKHFGRALLERQVNRLVVKPLMDRMSGQTAQCLKQIISKLVDLEDSVEIIARGMARNESNQVKTVVNQKGSIKSPDKSKSNDLHRTIRSRS